MTLPGDAEWSTKRQRQEEIPREQSQPLSSSSCAAADTSTQIVDPHIPKLSRQLSPAEREDNIQKRQRPSEVNTVLTTAEVYKGSKIASWTEDQKTVHTANQKDFLNMVKFGVVEVVDRPQSPQVITTRWEQTVRIVARGFEQIVSLDAFFLQERQCSRLCDDFSLVLQFTDSAERIRSRVCGASA